MNGMSPLVAVLDASVLYSAPLRHLLITRERTLLCGNSGELTGPLPTPSPSSSQVGDGGEQAQVLDIFLLIKKRFLIRKT